MTDCLIKSWRVVVFGLSLFLSACGGGGGSSDAPPASNQPPALNPELSLSFGLKQLLFSWQPVSDVAYYRLLANLDGVSGYSQLGADLSAQSTSTRVDIAVHRFNWNNAMFILQACDQNNQCRDSNVVNTLSHIIETIGYFKASNSGANDHAGISVAVSADGTTLAVGASGEDSNATGVNGNQADNSAVDSGAVYLFVRGTDGWVQQAYIKASNTEAGDAFGTSLSLSADGNTLAVGAVSEDSNAIGITGAQSDNSASASGAVYVYVRSNNNWIQQAYIKASNTGAGDFFGNAVSLSADGTTLAVGAILEDGNGSSETDNSASNAGAVYVYVRSNNNWAQQAYLKASNADAGDWFGHAISLSANGNILAASASYESSSATGVNGGLGDNSAADSGAVYVFERNVSSWTQQAYVKASNTQSMDRFGNSLDLDDTGTTLAVAAYQEDSNAFGVDGDQSNNAASNAGAVYVFRYENNSWAQQAYIKASNTQADDWFGAAVALSGDGQWLAVDAILEDSNTLGVGGDENNDNATNSGAVYVFGYDGSAWNQQRYIKALNSGAGDGFGASLALSVDGTTVAVGATAEDGAAATVNGFPFNDDATNSGAVYLY